MTRSKLPQVVILCEDNQHYHALRAYLELLGFSRFIQRKAVPGKGSGKDFVEKQYATELKAYRSKKGRLHIAMIVVIDADEHTVSEVKKQFVRNEDEKIAIIVPKWHIETWFYYIEGNVCEEHEKYKNKVRIKPTQAAKKLYEKCSPVLPQDAPPSLQDACREIQRLFS